MEISLGFDLIGEDMDGTEADLSGAAPATMIAIDLDTFEAADDDFGKGDPAGWAHGTAVLTHRDRLVCHLTFSFESDPDDTIVVHGVLPRDGDGIGAGRLAITGGTGRFHKAAGSVAVRTRNPKRFGFTL